MAWLIEGVAVSVSASLAAHPLIAADTPLIERCLGAAPFLVITFAELAKIPVMKAIFRLKGMVLPASRRLPLAVAILSQRTLGGHTGDAWRRPSSG